jgi:hypothetical protein
MMSSVEVGVLVASNLYIFVIRHYGLSMVAPLLRAITIRSGYVAPWRVRYISAAIRVDELIVLIVLVL